MTGGIETVAKGIVMPSIQEAARKLKIAAGIDVFSIVMAYEVSTDDMIASVIYENGEEKAFNLQDQNKGKIKKVLKMIVGTAKYDLLIYSFLVKENAMQCETVLRGERRKIFKM